MLFMECSRLDAEKTCKEIEAYQFLKFRGAYMNVGSLRKARNQKNNLHTIIDNMLL